MFPIHSNILKKINRKTKSILAAEDKEKRQANVRYNVQSISINLNKHCKFFIMDEVSENFLRNVNKTTKRILKSNLTIFNLYLTVKAKNRMISKFPCRGRVKKVLLKSAKS